MNRQRISQDENPSSVGKTILWAVFAGIGLGIGFWIVNKVDQKLEKKSE
ncbi:hypothetical protein LCGC14_0541170 [marine sediment metagenome]|uniref:Uncharacterized protein n=1 Tax=marine sediment metagenome TaxID=412755 RepID=A0A0F9V0X2_9ZZZZ